MSQVIEWLKSTLPFDVSTIGYPILLRKELVKANEIFLFLKQYANSENSNAEKLAQEFTEKYLGIILHLAVSQSPYYRELWGRGSVRAEDISSFPVLTKQIIKSNFDALTNPKVPAIKCFDFNTGGSTGEPLRFKVARQCGLVDRVHQRHCLESMGYQRGDQVFAFDGSTIPSQYIHKRIFWKKKSFSQMPYGSVHLSSHFVNKSTIDSYLAFLEQERPSFLRGYPSFISDLAECIIAQKRRVDFVKGVLLTSESVLDYQYSLIRDAFCAPVTVQYGHSEMAVFATQPAGTTDYWCSPFYGFTEILDVNGQHVAAGEVGEVVVTGYFNYAMPFIRYKTGDLATYGGQRDGSVILKKLQGRDQDFVVNARDEKISITGLVFGRHYEAFKNIEKWQIRQLEPGHVLIQVIPRSTYTESDASELRRSFAELAAVNAVVEIVSEIPLTPGGKFRFVVHED